MTPHTSLTSKSMLLLTLLAVLAIVNAGLIIHGVQSRAQVNELSAKLVAVEESIDTKTTASQQEILQAIVAQGPRDFLIGDLQVIDFPRLEQGLEFAVRQYFAAANIEHAL